VPEPGDGAGVLLPTQERAYFYQPKNSEEGRFLIDYLSA